MLKKTFPNHSAATGGAWQPVDFSPGGFCKLLSGMTARLVSPDVAEARVETGPEIRNPSGAIHGGFLSAVSEQCLVLPLFLAGEADPLLTATVDFSVQFLAAGNPAEPIVARAELLRATGRMAFSRGILSQGDRAIVAFSGTTRLFSRKQEASAPITF